MLGKLFDKTFFVFFALALISGIACLWLRGSEAVLRASGQALELLILVVPQVAAGLLIGGFAQALVNRDWIARTLGAQSGFKGLALACFAGAVTPGGPFTSFPLVFSLWKSGADAGALIAYLTAWSLISIHRLIIWELPFMGTDFTLLRFLVSLPMPIVCGMLARWLVRHTRLRIEDAEGTA